MCCKNKSIIFNKTIKTLYQQHRLRVHRTCQQTSHTITNTRMQNLCAVLLCNKSHIISCFFAILIVHKKDVFYFMESTEKRLKTDIINFLNNPHMMFPFFKLARFLPNFVCNVEGKLCLIN